MTVISINAIARRCYQHIPVLVKPVVDYCPSASGLRILDMTFGYGGHCQQLLQGKSVATYVALDRDTANLDRCKDLQRLQASSRIVPLHGRFSDIYDLSERYPETLSPNSFDFILFDLGPSSMQLDDALRGFSLTRDGPLLMTMDALSTMTAAAAVNRLSGTQLANILRRYAEEKRAKSITNAIVEYRFAMGPIHTTRELADIVKSALPQERRKDSLSRPRHAATKVFQAVRIFVNNELNELVSGLAYAYQLLRVGGRCAIISFHSLEDRIVKTVFKERSLDALYPYQKEPAFLSKYTFSWTELTKKAVVSSEDERLTNPRSRSAKLRVGEKRR